MHSKKCKLAKLRVAFSSAGSKSSLWIDAKKKKESYGNFLSFSGLIISMLSSLSVSWLRSILIVFITFLTKHDDQCDGSNPGDEVQQDPPACATRVVKSSDTNGIRRDNQ